MTQKTITEEQLNEVVKVIVRHPGIINLDADDVRYVLSGKSGILYSAQQEGSDYQQFMKRIFKELSEKSQVKECQYMVMSIGMSAEEPMTMDDMDIINDFIGSLMNDVMEIKWGLKTNAEGEGMTIQVICTNALQ